MEQKPSALGVHLYANKISSRDFADMMAKELNRKKFSSRTVEKWRAGRTMPTGRNMIAIKALTGITADQMLESIGKAA